MNPDTVAIIFSQREMIRGHFLMTLQVPISFRKSLPGQFVMIRMESDHGPFLSRPLSISSVYSKGNETFMELLYKVVGKGTKLFSRLKEGTALRAAGPLGKGFDLSPSSRKIILIAGGIGVVPLAFLAQRCRERFPDPDIICYLGAGEAGVIPGLERLEQVCSEVKISTDDGSRGYHGTVTELFRQDLGCYNGDDVRIYSCGPRSMLRSLQTLLQDQPIACQVSLEERMACGIGACLGCVVRTRGDDGEEKLVRACTEGPVFDIKRVIFEA